MTFLSTLWLLPTIWVVDAQMGPGAHFADLPAAIAAAASGDTIVLRAGTYSGFLMDGKAVSIRGDGAAVTHVLGAPGAPAARILNSGDAVTVSGVHLKGAYGMVVSVAEVHLLDCELAGGDAPTGGIAGDGLAVVSSALVVACRSSFRGGAANTAGGAATASLGGEGVSVAGDLGFVADQCFLRGGDAFGPPGSSTAGGNGLSCTGRARLDRSSCRGGDSSGTAGAGVVAIFGEVRIAGGPTSYVAGGNVVGVTSWSIQSYFASVFLHAPVSAFGPVQGSVQPAAELPRLRVDGATRPDGALDAMQPVLVTYEGLVPNGLGLLALGAPSLAPPVAPFATELLIGAGGFFLVVPLDAAGRLLFQYTPAAIGGPLLGVPVCLQGASLVPALGSVLTSNLDVHVALP